MLDNCSLLGPTRHLQTVQFCCFWHVSGACTPFTPHTTQHRDLTSTIILHPCSKQCAHICEGQWATRVLLGDRLRVSTCAEKRAEKGGEGWSGGGGCFSSFQEGGCLNWSTPPPGVCPVSLSSVYVVGCEYLAAAISRQDGLATAAGNTITLSCHAAAASLHGAVLHRRCRVFEALSVGA